MKGWSSFYPYSIKYCRPKLDTGLMDEISKKAEMMGISVSPLGR
ncbi:hypothetical protein H0A61_00108 [Koleobacter methoxysyntrophicus]|uniref:Uncharacterized protein n=1 Tax=Koleobacter methoxysyntrophicus TaxID=2751313 RepID=A0A8A0RIR8_9FIRM|nr:hypothetical protein [Koleobacter methoxysyntrophicus]QSQ07792.1 hypothetical protein H0A61_00108 [Koleobacter methoxysyntrophicus]